MTFQTSKTRYDAIVIGARAAGAATALCLARGGAKVLVVERDAILGDTLSTHALMRPAVQLLSHWGVLQAATRDTFCVSSTTFQYGQNAIKIPIKPTPGVPGLFAPRRYQLDGALLDAAREAGASVMLGTQCDGVIRKDSKIVGVHLTSRDGTRHQISCGLLVGADGRRSQIAEMVGAATHTTSIHASASIYAYVEGLQNRGYQWYYAEGAAAGLIPTTHNQHCLFTSCRPSEFRQKFGRGTFDDILNVLAHWEPELAIDLRTRGATARPRRFLGAPGHIKQATGPGWALVGDAGYFKDPASAHGITDALLDAERLSRAFLASPADLSTFQTERDRHAAPMFEATQKMAAMNWTMSELQDLHGDLSRCMKAESRTIDHLGTPIASAA